MSDFHLMLIVLGTVGIGQILLIIGESVPSFRPKAVLLPDDETPSDTNVCGGGRGIGTYKCLWVVGGVGYKVWSGD